MRHTPKTWQTWPGRWRSQGEGEEKLHLGDRGGGQGGRGRGRHAEGERLMWEDRPLTLPFYSFLAPLPLPSPYPLLPPGCFARSAAVGQLVEAVAHEVYRQISNRYSLNAGFQPPELLRVLQAYAQLQYEDSECATRGTGFELEFKLVGTAFYPPIALLRPCSHYLAHAGHRCPALLALSHSPCPHLPSPYSPRPAHPAACLPAHAVTVSRMLDAIAGHCVKKIRSNHDSAPRDPLHISQLLHWYIELQHK